MKRLIIGITYMALSMTNSVHANTNNTDSAALKSIVESVAVLADTGQFEVLETHFADELKVDYTSLNGGEAEIKSPQVLMTEWANVLPGFDRTRHQISDIETAMTGNSATATAKVTADHYVADLFWQVEGRYAYEFMKSDGT